MTQKLVLKQEKAIRLCKKQGKLVLDGHVSGKPYHRVLCFYDQQFNADCSHCPLQRQFHHSCRVIGMDFYKNPKEFAALIMRLK